jgi:hypothetical protein
MESNWKLVPPELVFGASDVWASSCGKLRVASKYYANDAILSDNDIDAVLE